ncbi:MAG: family 1 encapsulin nanocompartment shell protein [Bacteroidales bacterium]
MDILKQSLAPVSSEAWEEIKSEAKRVLNTHLSARKFINVSEPKGWDYGAVPSGRLDIPGNQNKNGVIYGINKVQPLVEPRIRFFLNIWELDNLARGAKDIDLDSMEEAAIKLAEFEEKTIYYGLSNASVTGLKDCNKGEKLVFPEQIEDLLAVVSQGITKLNRASIEGPYALIVSPDKWQKISSHFKGYPLRMQLEKLLGGPVILSHFIKEGFLAPADASELNLILGQDISIGYESHDDKKVRMFFTESFTLQIHDPATIIMID